MYWLYEELIHPISATSIIAAALVVMLASIGPGVVGQGTAARQVVIHENGVY